MSNPNRIYRALVIDDERLARRDLINMLMQYDQIEVAGEAEDAATAQKLIYSLRPDVLFLDIQMPGQSGFDLINLLDVVPKIIFVTAFDSYTLRAFEVNALDYLLKPIAPERLRAAVARLGQDEPAAPRVQRPLQYEDRLLLLLDNLLRFVKLADICAINAAGDYTELWLANGAKGITLKSMKEWESRLPEKQFCRIHRSTIINLEYVDRIEEWFNYALRVYLKGIAQPFLISRRYAVRLRDRFA
jgi:two-component system LytT family response regulator